MSLRSGRRVGGAENPPVYGLTLRVEKDGMDHLEDPAKN